jgi:hypothetical protein
MDWSEDEEHRRFFSRVDELEAVIAGTGARTTSSAACR